MLAQLLAFDLTKAAPDPTTFDLTGVVTGITFEAKAVRVVSSTPTLTRLLVAGHDKTYAATYHGVVVYGSVAAGSSSFKVLGSVVLDGAWLETGATALSQTSPLLPGHVLASTDKGVFKCALRHAPAPVNRVIARRCGSTLLRCNEVINTRMHDDAVTFPSIELSAAMSVHGG